MKKDFKRALSALLAIVMMLGLLIVPAAAEVAETPVGGDAPVVGDTGAAVLGETIAETPRGSSRAASAAAAASTAADNSWTAALDKLTTSETSGVSGKYTAETKIDVGVEGVEFYVGPDDYKMADNKEDGMPSALTGANTGSKYTKEDGTLANINDKNPVPDGGSYFKWVAANDGVLTIHGIVNANKTLYITVNGEVKADLAGNGAKDAAKKEYTWTISVKKGDKVYFALDGNSKPQLVDFSFVVVETVGGSWTAALDNLTTSETPGVSGKYTAETKIDVGVEGVEFYVGPDDYKMADNKEDGMPSALTGANTGSKYTKEDGTLANINDKNPVPDGGSYFKWVATMDGVLTIHGIVNANKTLYITVNGAVKADLAGNGTKDAAKKEYTWTISVKKDDKVYFALDGNSKPQLVDFSFAGGGMEEVIVVWTADAITDGKGFTVSPVVGEDGTIAVTVTGPQVGTVVDAAAKQMKKYADKLTVEMYDESGAKVASSISEDPGNTHTFTLTPEATGKYTFKALAQRSGETDLESAMTTAVDFTLPLAAPSSLTAASQGVGADGKGTVEVAWQPTPEATGYNVYVGDSATPANGDTPITKTRYTVTGLELDTEYTFAVEALRNDEKSEKATVTGTPSEAVERAWGFTKYGESSSDKEEENGFSGSVADNDLKVWSKNGKGKVTDKADGVCFYYTAVPNEYNFRLRANIHVDEWTWSNGQEGFGILATDTLGKRDGESSVYHNNFMLGATKSDDKDVKFDGYLGLVMIEETGYTNEWLAEQKANGNTAITPPNGSTHYNMDPWIIQAGITGGYNLIGNCTNPTSNTKAQGIDELTASSLKLPLLTDFVLELRRNNTGYFAYYYATMEDAENGAAPLMVKKTYDPNALSVMDEDNVYVGFFTARNATISVTDVQLETIPPEKDDPVEEPEPIYVTPTLTIQSTKNANSEDYNLILTSNVRGTVDVTINGKTVATGAAIDVQGTDTADAKDGLRRLNLPVTLKAGSNIVSATMTPLPESEQGFANDYTFLESSQPKTVTNTVKYETKFADQANLYVAPNGNAYNLGTSDDPLDIFTAVQVAQPGQKIIVKEGTYKLSSAVVVAEGNDGTKENPIYLIADPEAASRPVFDAQGKDVGIEFSGDYWYVKGIDVTNSKEGEEGIALAGSYNVFESVYTYRNRGSGMQVSRISGYNVLKEDWPTGNVLINCVSFLNSDSGEEDADGFGSKLTIGEDNVFYGCVAAYNADDGWDCFAKASTGSIGKVVLHNCYAFMNGFVLDKDGTYVTRGVGNGNGFKMGGESLPGSHAVYDSYSFGNAMKGFDSNSCPDVTYENGIAYNNWSANVAYYTNNASNTAFVGANMISVKDNTMPNPAEVGGTKDKDKKGFGDSDTLKGVGSQVEADYKNDTTYYWDGAKSANKSGASLPATADLFVSIDMEAATKAMINVADNTVTVDETGAVTLGDFLKLKDTVDDSIKAMAPKAMDLSQVVYPIDIDPDYATIVPDDISTSTSDKTSGRGDSDRGTNNGDSTTTPEGPVVESHTNADGTVVTTVTQTDGSVATVEKKPDGTVDVTAKDAQGEVLVDMTLPAEAPTTSDRFVDVPDSFWAADAINEMAARGLVQGVDAEHFDTGSDVTRGTLATLLFRLSNGKEGYENTFTDVADGAWYADAVAWAAKAGVVTGYEDGTFVADAAITREQMALMLYRYANLIGMVSDKTADFTAFADGSKVSAWAADGMEWAVANGIITGKLGSVLDPQASATRAETAVMLGRFIDLMK